MKSKSLFGSLLLTAALAVAIPVFAKPMSTSLPVSHTVRFGQADVKTGDYRLLIDGNHLTILNGRKTIAEAEGRWEERDAKSQYTEILSDGDGQVKELRFAGKKSVFVLQQ